MENKMFCFQCQEAAGCSGCTIKGVCGKTPELAKVQDLLIYVTKGLSEVTVQARKENIKISSEINNLVTLNLFTTITNANFDENVISKRVDQTLKIKNELLTKINNKENLTFAALETNRDNYKNYGVLEAENEDVRSLRELIMYGLKGLSAYLKHANELG